MCQLYSFNLHEYISVTGVENMSFHKYPTKRNPSLFTVVSMNLVTLVRCYCLFVAFEFPCFQYKGTITSSIRIV